MARYISKGHDTSGGSIGDLRPVTAAEYTALLPGATSDNKLYFLYDTGVLKYNTYTFNTAGDLSSPKLLKVRELTLEEYNALTDSEKLSDTLFMLTNREVIVYKKHVFGDVMVTDGMEERYVFYQWESQLATYKDQVAQLTVELNALKAQVAALQPEYITKGDLAALIDAGTYVKNKVYIVHE